MTAPADACPECDGSEVCESWCPSRTRFAELMTALCFSEDPEDQAKFHEALEMLGVAEPSS